MLSKQSLDLLEEEMETLSAKPNYSTTKQWKKRLKNGQISDNI